jgi:aerobic-type carbon monoxide dehydrogenase small subunit (CoxS/CutS family)
MRDSFPITVTVNGIEYQETVETRINLADFLRHRLGLTGTHVGCEHGVCGACTVLVNGASVRSCLMLAVQARDSEIRTIEDLETEDGLDPLQEALSKHFGLQCGYCTPGVLMTLVELRTELEGKSIDEAMVRRKLAGNLCRCTGYQGMVDAALEVLNTPVACLIGEDKIDVPSNSLTDRHADQ